MSLVRGQEAVVVDASMALPFLQGDAAAFATWDSWRANDDLVLVPPLFPIEVANALLRGTSIRSTSRVLELLSLLELAGYEVADRGSAGVARSVQLAATHRLSVYDAAYLDLALDIDASLATLDRDLRRAADAEGVPVIP